MEVDNKNEIKELDLFDLLKSVFNSFGRILKSLYSFIIKCVFYIVLFACRRYQILIASLLLGMIIGFAKHNLVKSAYKSDLVIQSNDVPNEDIIKKINELAVYAEDENYEMLASKLEIDLLMAQSVTEIGAFWFIDNDRDGVADFVDYNNRYNAVVDTMSFRVTRLLDIRAGVLNPDAFRELQNGIIRFLEKDHRLTMLNKNRKAGLKLKISRIDRELEKLDSLQNYEYFDKDREISLDLENIGSLKMLGEEKDTRLLHEEIISLQERKLQYEKEMEVNGGLVSVVADFPVTVKPYRSLGRSSLDYGISLATFVYLLMFIFSHRKSMLTYMEKKSYSGKK